MVRKNAWRIELGVIMMFLLLITGSIISNIPAIEAKEEICDIKVTTTEGRISSNRVSSALSSVSPAALGFNYTERHWPDNSIPAPYWISTSVPSSWVLVIQQAFRTWENVPGSYIAYEYMGLTPIGAPHSRDYKNVVSCGTMQEGWLAYCASWPVTGELSEFDIVFKIDENWSATENCPSNSYDVKSVCTHEAGHTLSLNDLYDLADSEETMYGYLSTGEIKKRDLYTGDIAGASYIYPYNPPPPVHDVAIINVTASKAIATQGDTLSVNVTFKNEGDYPEILNVDIKANDSTIGTLRNRFLVNGSSTTVPFQWNTVSFAPAKYTISAYLWPVPSETNTTDNNYIDGTVTILSPIYVHDIAVKKITPYKTIVGKDFPVSINVIVENRGNATETFNISLYVNATTAGNKTVYNLAGDKNITVNFFWNTSGFPKANYTLSAYAWPVPNEIDTTDNTLSEGLITIWTPAADVNLDRKVDLRDVFMVGKAYGLPTFDPILDINGDGKVDLKDYYIVCKNYGKQEQ